MGEHNIQHRFHRLLVRVSQQRSNSLLERALVQFKQTPLKIDSYSYTDHATAGKIQYGQGWVSSGLGAAVALGAQPRLVCFSRMHGPTGNPHPILTSSSPHPHVILIILTSTSPHPHNPHPILTRTDTGHGTRPTLRALWHSRGGVRLSRDRDSRGEFHV